MSFSAPWNIHGGDAQATERSETPVAEIESAAQIRAQLIELIGGQ